MSQRKIKYDDQIEELDGYRGSANLKKIGTEIQWTSELAEEYLKCKKDPIYFAENYMQVVQDEVGLQLINLYPYQKEIIYSLRDNRYTVAECARQSGKTTAVTCFVLWFILFQEYKFIGILANKEKTAKEILERIKLAYEFLPDWLQQGVKEWNKTEIILENGCSIMAAATSNDSIRGFTMDVVYIDEAAHVTNWDDFFTSTFPVISSRKNSKVMLVSTVNGLNHFYKITEFARQGKNNYNLISVDWTKVPGRDARWREETIAGMNFDEDKFAQEYENRYLGSSGTLIAGWKLQELAPQVPLMEKDNIVQYCAPLEHHNYALIADVSRGRGLDYSAFQIIDVTTMPYQQVMTFRDNFMAPADFSEVINRAGKHYNEASVLIETNDIGGQVADMLFEDFEYPNMLFTDNAGPRGKKITQGMKPNTDKGIRTTTLTKSVGCSILKLLIEQNQLLIHDANTIYELSTFSKKGKSYEAETGHNDDLVMCLVLFAWLSDQGFFKMINDIDTMLKLRELKEEQIQSDLMPFGFIDDQVDDPDEIFAIPSDNEDFYLFGDGFGGKQDRDLLN
jgi:hypothetical protein